MKAVSFLLSVFAFAAAVTPAHASGPVGVYALVDKVEMEPNAATPERIRVYGVFSIAQGQTNRYAAPSRGILYFTPGRNPDKARKEWADLASVAGTRQVVGFGAAWYGVPTVLRGVNGQSADEYVLNAGVVKVNAEQPQAKALLEFKDR